MTIGWTCFLDTFTTEHTKRGLAVISGWEEGRGHHRAHLAGWKNMSGLTPLCTSGPTLLYTSVPTLFVHERANFCVPVDQPFCVQVG